MQITLRSLLLALPAIFTLACDDAGPDVSAAEIEAAARAAGHTELPLTTIHHTDTGLAAQVAAHPAFAPLSQRAYLRVGDILEAKAAMTRPELEASYTRLEHCRSVSSTLCAEEVL